MAYHLEDHAQEKRISLGIPFTDIDRAFLYPHQIVPDNRRPHVITRRIYHGFIILNRRVYILRLPVDLATIPPTIKTVYYADHRRYIQ